MTVFDRNSGRQSILDRIEGSLFQGALGDSYGAAVEVLKLEEILERVGPGGVTDLLPYNPGDYLSDRNHYGLGPWLGINSSCFFATFSRKTCRLLKAMMLN